jgi:hypothetical protein
VKRIQEPGEELGRIALTREQKSLLRFLAHFLQQLVRTHLPLERSRIPDLLDQNAKPLDWKQFQDQRAGRKTDNHQKKEKILPSSGAESSLKAMKKFLSLHTCARAWMTTFR